ncbi:TPA: LamG domain-containing protein [Candidatus Poribacteria bacterium]|nr:LamG domain-containing protein [Candidatus Poribacteria bacterium]
MKNGMGKLTFISVSLIILGLVFSSPGYTVDKESIVLAWTFEEGQGTTVKDLSGNGNDGEIVGGQWATGKFGGGYELLGADTSIASATANGVGATYLAETLWVKYNNFDTENQFGYISCTGTASARFFYFSTWVSGGPPHDGIHLGTIKTDGGWGRGIGVPSGVFQPDQWYFVAGVINNETGVTRAYVDGELRHEQNFDIGDTPGTPTEIWVGGTPEGYQWINGTIDEVAFYNVALTEDDINSIMNNGLATVVAAVDPLSKLTTTWGKIKNVR